MIQLNVSFLPAFPGYSFQRCCGLALSSNTRSQSSLRAAAQTLLRYISAVSYKEQMCLITVGGSLYLGFIIIVIFIVIYYYYYYFYYYYLNFFRQRILRATLQAKQKQLYISHSGAFPQYDKISNYYT